MTFALRAPEALQHVVESTELVALDDVGEPLGVSGVEPQYRFEAERSITMLAESLATVHSMDLADLEIHRAPVETTSTLVDRARVRAGSSADATDPEPLSPPYAHMTRARLVEVLAEGSNSISRRSGPEVLLQGTPTLANLRFDGTAVTGFADWSRAGIGDRYMDLALACRDLVELFGPVPLQMFLNAYSSDRLDPIRLDWYSLAAELCR